MKFTTANIPYAENVKLAAETESGAKGYLTPAQIHAQISGYTLHRLAVSSGTPSLVELVEVQQFYSPVIRDSVGGLFMIDNEVAIHLDATPVGGPSESYSIDIHGLKMLTDLFLRFPYGAVFGADINVRDLPNLERLSLAAPWAVVLSSLPKLLYVELENSYWPAEIAQDIFVQQLTNLASANPPNDGELAYTGAGLIPSGPGYDALLAKGWLIYEF